MKILISSDVYNICNRIKNFDASYHLVWDNTIQKYKIYSSRIMHSFELIGGLKLSYVCTLPYDQLDARSIKYLYETSMENLEDIIRSIDCTNKKIEVDNEVKLKANAYLVAENKLRQLTK